jgi:polyphosphate kinase 2 (PPK2 family)
MRLGECTAHSAIALKDSWDAMSKQNRIAARFRIENGKNFKLKHVDSADTGQISSKEEAKQLLEEGIAALQDMQDKLYAQDQWALLIVIQAMDAAGKDSLIKHVMSGVNPARLRGTLLQSAFRRGTRPRLLMAPRFPLASPRENRHFQSIALRRGSRRACAP